MNTVFVKYVKYSIVLLAVCVGWFAHSYYFTHIADREGEVFQIRENSTKYKFINPLILVADRRKIEFGEYVDLKEQIDEYIHGQVSQGHAQDVSVYFRDLNGGEWISVHPDTLYAPSSMMKVATLMAYLKLAEDNPKILDERVMYTPTGSKGQNYKPEKPLAQGMYSVRELLTQTIVESDNDAVSALNSIHAEEVLKIYRDLELPDPLSDEIDFMTAASYSRLFRTLYNGSYISRKYSEEALRLLSTTKFNRGITASTGSTTVSHKFGELTFLEKGKAPKRELHDCGIIYAPQSPYALCIMTRGREFPYLEKIISDISKMVYEYPKN